MSKNKNVDQTVEQEHLNDDGDDDDEIDDQKFKWYHINTAILPAKCSYFFECARRIGFTPNLVLFLTSIGLTKVEAGFIVGFRLIGQLLGGPFWGMISDKWHCHRTVIILMSSGAVITMASQPFISVQYGNLESNRCPLVSAAMSSTQLLATNHTICSNLTVACSGILHNGSVINNSGEKQQNLTICSNLAKMCTSFNHSVINNNTNPSQQQQQETDHQQFGALFAVMFFINLAISFCEGSAVAFIDTATIRKSQLSPHRTINYGRQRMFSAPGGAFGITLSNLAVEYFPAADVSCYSGVFLVYILSTIVYTGFVLYLYRGLSFKNHSEENDKESIALKRVNDEHSIVLNEINDKKPINGTYDNESTTSNEENAEKSMKTIEEKKAFRRILVKTLKRYDIVFFYMTAFAAGLEYSQHVSFTLLFLKEMDAPAITMSFAFIASNAGSLLGFAFSDRIIVLVGGIWRTMALAFVMFFVRYFGISMATNPWVIVFFQTFHGCTTALALAACVIHLKNTSPLPVITTLLALLNSVHYGVGTIVGSSIGGVVYEHYGGRVLYRSTAVLAVVWVVVLVLFILMERRRRQTCQKESDDEKMQSEGAMLMEKL